jgi:hypothetical protein
MGVRHKFIGVVGVAVLDAGADPSRTRSPQPVADPALAEGSHLEAIGEQTLAEASYLPCSCVVDFRCPDRITDCIRRAPEPPPRLTICDLLTRSHGLAFGVTDGARTRDLL